MIDQRRSLIEAGQHPDRQLTAGDPDREPQVVQGRAAADRDLTRRDVVWDPARVGVQFHAVPRLARQHDFPGSLVEDGWRALDLFDDPRQIGMPWHASPLFARHSILTARLPETGCGRQRQMSRAWHLGQFDEGVQASRRVQGGQPGDGDEHHGRADQQHAGARRRPEQRGHPPGPGLTPGLARGTGALRDRARRPRG